jgi:hypothetical protein
MKSNLQKAIDALEDAGFHVDRAYEEIFRDLSKNAEYPGEHTGAICLRITPVKEDGVRTA